MYTNSSPTSNMYTFSNLESNTLYTVSVAAINCAGFNQTSKNSEMQYAIYPIVLDLDKSKGSIYFVFLMH